MKSRFDAVAFDVDGTLYANRDMYLYSVPFFLTHPRLVFHYGRVRREIRKRRPIQDFYGLQAELLAKRLGADTAKTRTRLDSLIYEKWESVLARIPRYRGVKELVLELRESGVKTAVMSDFPVGRKLQFLGLEGLFDVAFSAETTGYLKPNPEPFELLLAELQVDRSQLLYVGNSYSYDVVGAKSAGLAVAHLTSSPSEDSQADFSFASYEELRAWLDVS